MGAEEKIKDDRVKVEIIILSYNQEAFLTQALDSVLQQKTDFPFRIIASDDGSTDHTVDIWKAYQKKYPGKIKLLTAERNGGNLVNIIRAMETLNCEYFSLLDGDDFWVGDDRLQEQVDFLDQNPQYSSCGGQIRLLEGEKLTGAIPPAEMLGTDYTFADAFQRPTLIHTSSLLLRNVVFSPHIPHVFYDVITTFENCALRGEDFRRLAHLEHGPCRILPRVMSVYRIQKKGIWSGASHAKQAIEGAISAHFDQKYFGSRHPELKKEIDAFAATRYQQMWATLINEKYVYPEYRLSEAEGNLLRDFLNELNQEKKKETLLKRTMHD